MKNALLRLARELAIWSDAALVCGQEQDSKALLKVALCIYEFIDKGMPANEQVFSAARGETALVLANIEDEGLVADEINLEYQAEPEDFILFDTATDFAVLRSELRNAEVMRA